MTSIVDNVLHGLVGLPQEIVLPVLPLRVLINVNLPLLCADIWIMMPQVTLLMFSMTPWSWWSPPCPLSRWSSGSGSHKCEFVFPMCWHFKNDATSNIDDVLHDHVELPHVLPLAVHLVMVLRKVSKVPSVIHKSKSHHWPATHGDVCRSKICKLQNFPPAPEWKCRLRCWGVARLWSTWNFFWEVPTLYILVWKRF